MQEIPANLENYRAEILEGLKAAEQRRREFALNFPRIGKQQPDCTKNGPQEDPGSALQLPGDKNTGENPLESSLSQNPEVLAGLAAAGRRNIELSKAWGYPHDRPGSRIVESIDAAGVSLETLPAFIATNSDVIRPIKIWPLIGISAWRQNKGGPWRVWALAKYLDPSGRGAIQEADLQALARELGIHPKTWHRWMNAAKQIGLIKGIAKERILIAGCSIVARLFGCNSIGSRPAQVPIDELVGPAWRAHVWAAYEVTHLGRPISRIRQEALTGVPISTQRTYDNAANVIRKSGISISSLTIDKLSGVIEFEGRPGAFQIFDRKLHKFVIAWHSPDSRTSNSAISLQRGRSRKINKALGKNNGSSILGRAPSSFSSNIPTFRLFHRTMTQARATERKLARSGQTPPHEIYLYSSGGINVDFWRPLPYDRDGSSLAVSA